MLVPAVTAPVPAALELTFHVTPEAGLLTPETAADNWSVPPLAADGPDGPTLTLVTVGGVTAGPGAGVCTGGGAGAAAVTVAKTLPDFEGSTTEVAIM